jgi:hypothetical protein
MKTVITLIIGYIVLISSSDMPAPKEFSQLVLEGDSCFQEQNFAEAIVKYEQARKLDSSHPELLRNLTAAYKNSANSANTLFISDISSFSNQLFNPRFKDLYAFTSYILLILSIIFFTRDLSVTHHKKIHLILYSLAVLSIVLALVTQSTNSKEAIVNISEAKIYESTSETAPLVTSVNPGYKVRVLKSYEEWSSIELPTKQKGWIKNNVIKPI